MGQMGLEETLIIVLLAAVAGVQLRKLGRFLKRVPDQNPR
jgi:hypothetical protein